MPTSPSLRSEQLGAPNPPAILKKDAQTGQIPIIGLSAHAMDSEREQAIAIGCDDFDTKPIDFEGLIATIRRVLATAK
jgi:two-component system, cell cycle response regulator DivK